MGNRTEYEMTEAQLATLLEACRPPAYIIFNGTEPISPQEKVNRAWSKLGREMGFDSTTVRPASGKGDRYFTAIPTATGATHEH